jgi:hypothetical protein
MNRCCSLLTFMLIASYAHAQTPVKAPGYRIKYDHHALRIPGNKFAIGLTIPADGKTPPKNIGYSGSGGFGKYHVEVDSGSFSSGNVKVHDSKLYKKGDSITVNVYTRKWFLGGRGKFLTNRKIPYNYEDSIVVMTNSNSGRFPGGHIKFGIRTIFDNHQSAELWYPVKKKNRNNFLLGFEGGNLSRSKGDWKINPDPTQINEDEVKLFARLAKDPVIGDTLRLLLDYKALFQYNISSSSDGHELDVTADAFYDPIISQELLKIELNDVAEGRTYHYLVNTNGGAMNISSRGADGANGDNGVSGSDGRSGTDGPLSRVAQTTTNADGTTTTTYITVQGAGGNGEDGGPGGDGENGDNGYNGGDITIHYTPAAAPFLKLIGAISIPGSGGLGGNGGSGGNGGNGGSGNPPGSSGSRGSDGRSGSSGVSGTRGFVRFAAL